MPSRQEQRLISRPRTDQGKLVWCCSPESSPRADRRDLRQPGHVFLSARQHARKNLVIHFLVFCPVLPRRPDENLAGSTRLDIEGHGILVQCARAFQVAQFDELMPDETRVAIGDYQMSFSFSYLETWGELRRARAGRVYNKLRGETRAVGGELSRQVRCCVHPGRPPAIGRRFGSSRCSEGESRTSVGTPRLP